jgi:hypothetical protein
MIADKHSLLKIIDDIESGEIDDLEHGLTLLRNAVQRLDEMDDLVDAVCTCRTVEIPILRRKLDEGMGRA